MFVRYEPQQMLQYNDLYNSCFFLSENEDCSAKVFIPANCES